MLVTHNGIAQPITAQPLTNPMYKLIAYANPSSSVLTNYM